MYFLKLPIRQDWHTFQQAEMAAAGQRFRRVRNLVLCMVAAVFLLQVLPLSPGLTTTLKAAATSAVFLAFVTSPSGTGGSLQPALFALRYAFFLLPVLLAGIAYPLAGPPPLGYWNGIALFLALLAPGLSFSGLAWFWRRSPAAAQWAASFASRWLLKLLLGLFAGGALALHLAYTFQSLEIPFFEFAPLRLVAWSFCFQLGLTALGEELFFRGFVFDLLHEELRRSLWVSALQIAGLTLLLDLTVFSFAPGLLSITGLVVLFYRFSLSILNTFLYQRTGSLIPGLAANVLFTAVLWSAIH